ncbi:hypothetical protein D2Q93_13095 [Alicyclobacillaceae bacterium I2511]|nr:hypothetical protein D2Q93_13095 [Alicyclobacillaceae bacterium I2511]
MFFTTLKEIDSMFANWLRSGWASGRVTTRYPFHRTEILQQHSNWHVVPKIVASCSRSECSCTHLCPTGAIGKDVTGVWLNQAACIGCGRCVTQCPVGVFAWSPVIDLAVTQMESLRTRTEP